MTFLEAAIAILQREGRPLHFKQLTESALKLNLLTVVGRTPEATMQQRLNDALKKNDPTLLLTREKPGTYGLRYYAHPADDTAGNAAAKAPGADGTTVADAPVSTTPDAVEAATEKADEGAGKRRNRRRGGRGRGRDGAEEKEAESATGSEGVAISESARTSATPAAVVEKKGKAASPPIAIHGKGQAPNQDVIVSERVPERHSFAEAAAVVAAGHRQRPEHENKSAAVEHGGGSSAGSVSASPPAKIATPPSTMFRVPPSSPEALQAELRGTAFSDEQPYSDDQDIETPTGPLIAPSHGTEELVRGEDHRNVIEEGPQRRRTREPQHTQGTQMFKERTHPQPHPEQATHAASGRPERERSRRDRQHPDRSRPHAGAGPTTAPARPVAPDQKAAPPTATAAASSATAPRAGVDALPIDAVIEILRAQEGRSVHVRQITEMALKRKLLRGDAAEMVRLLRAAILADARERESLGLRPRVRATGGLSYMLDRRLENELYQLERELSDRVSRLAELTRTVLLRRLVHLAAGPFEALMRVVIGRLGVSPVELIKRGEGVAYFAGERKVANGRRKVLVAVRPGEAELTSTAIGELRAGLSARGFEEGLLLAAGRAGAEALAEMTQNGGSITLHDGEDLAMLCARLGVGTMRRTIAIEVLDVDLLAEVQEA